MPDFLTSLLRTYVPIAVGALVSWLLTLGVELDAETQAGLIVALTGLSQAAYYALVRAVEPHMPDWLTRIVLGSAKAPAYDDGGPIVAGRVLPDAEASTDITKGR
jgi:hypothetical protein